MDNPISQQPAQTTMPQPVPVEPELVAPSPVPSPPIAAQPASLPPKPKSKGLPKMLLFVVLLIIFLGIAGFVFMQVQSRLDTGSTEETTEDLAAHVFEEYPDVEGIPITENTISFVKADGKFCLLYKDKVYVPQDTGSLTPRVKDVTEEMLSFPWIGLVDAPEDLVPELGDEIFSFEESPSNKSFVFITRWNTESSENYHMFRFHNNSLSELKVFNQSDGLFFAPKVNVFSPGGNFLNLSLFRCANCIEDYPETLLYYIPTAEVRNIGKTSDFAWGEDDNTYNYRQYEEGVPSGDQPIRTNEFFERSIDLLTP